MALCYLPCFGEARILLRSGVSVSLSNGNNNKGSLFPCNAALTSSTNVRRYHCRWHRHGIPLPYHLNLRQATRTLQKPWMLIPIASVAQSNRPAVTSEERPSGSLLSFSYAPPIVSGEDGEDADGGRAYSSSSDVDSREQLRRERIARANKGRVPWNKGRRHSPETIAKIKERTKTAMLNPQIRDKLRSSGKSQTLETRIKIREKLVGYWEGKRAVREKQALFESEWKELIAEAARVGAPGEEEFEWDSYKKIKERYKLEELKTEKQKKAALQARLKRERRRKPISEAHRKAISDAIRAKWADPEYQAKVSAGLAKAGVDLRRKSPPLSHVIAFDTFEKKGASRKSPTSTAVIPKEVLVEKKKPVQTVPVDEDFIAEVLAEEVTLQTKRKRSTAARIKGPQKVTLVSLEDHNLPSGDDSEAAADIKDRSSGQEEEGMPRGTVEESPLAEADEVTPTSAGGLGDVHLSCKLSSQSHNDPVVLEKVQRIQQLRQGRLEVESKRKEAADRARTLIANAEKAANALEKAGNVDAVTLATLKEARRVLAEATRSVQAAELKPGTVALDKAPTPPPLLPPPRSSRTKQSEKVASLIRGGDFHSRIWTEGDSIEDCPHPIPIRFGKSLSREAQQPQPQPHLDEGTGGASTISSSSCSSGSGSAAAGWATDEEAETPRDGEAAEGAVGQAPAGSAGQNNEDDDDEVVHGDEEGFLMVAAAEEGAGSDRASKSSSTRGSKKRWHRGRLVVMNDEERT